VYQSTFSPSTRWTKDYAKGKEILEYLRGVAQKYDVYKYTQFQRRITMEE